MMGTNVPIYTKYTMLIDVIIWIQLNNNEMWTMSLLHETFMVKLIYHVQQIINMLELKLGLLGFMAWHIVCSLLLRLYFVRDCIIVADFTKHATVYVTVYTGHLYLADDKVKWINMREAMGRNTAGTRGKSLSPLLTVFHTCAQIFPERGGVKDMG